MSTDYSKLSVEELTIISAATLSLLAVISIPNRKKRNAASRLESDFNRERFHQEPHELPSRSPYR